MDYNNNFLLNQPGTSQEFPIVDPNVKLEEPFLALNNAEIQHYYQLPFPTFDTHPIKLEETSPLFIDSIASEQTPKVTTNNNTSDQSPAVKKKRATKRQDHNTVERKRRDQINDNIKCLGELLPDSLWQGKVNKGKILQGSVTYIKMLEAQLAQQRSRLEYLQNELASYKAFAPK